MTVKSNAPEVKNIENYLVKYILVKIKHDAFWAADISESAGIDVLNKEHVICHLDDGADLKSAVEAVKKAGGSLTLTSETSY